MKYLIFTLLLLITFSCLSAAQQKPTLTGNWQGNISAQGQHLIIKTHFKKQKTGYSGTIDIPQQGGKGLKLKKINRMKADSVSWVLYAAGSVIAKFKGHFKTDSLIVGTFYQRGYQFPFEISRYTPKMTKQKPLPYHHKDVTINKNDSVNIGGTLTWPQKRITNQLVIMISGSGANNRDETIAGFKIFGQIAHYLTRHGIATYRYDDRGIGKSTGSFTQAGLSKLASDVEAIITHLSSDSTHHFTNITLLGHSQGGYIGAKVAAQDTLVDKLILMSSPGIPLKKIILYQSGYADMEKAILDTLQGSQNFSQLTDSLVKIDMKKFKQKPDSIKKRIKNTREHFQKKWHQEFKVMESPSYFSFFDYDPAKDLSKLRIPVLAIFGGKDQQVPIDLNRAPIQTALDSAGVSYQINVFKNANHLYQKAKTENYKNYGRLPKTFVKGFLSTITQWIRQKDKSE